MSTKDAYQQKLEAQLREWQADIDKLKARADQADADRKIAYDNEIDSLQQKQQALRQKLEQLRSSGEDAWEELRSGAEKAWKDMDNAFKSALTRFR